MVVYYRSAKGEYACCKCWGKSHGQSCSCRHCSHDSRATRSAAAIAPYTKAGDAVVARRLVRVLRPVLHRLYRDRPVQSRHLHSTTQGLFDLKGFASFVAALFLGLFIGTLAFSWLSDRFGRRSIFTFALLWYSIGAFIMAFQNTPESIDLWRLIASIGLGVELVNVDAYVSELVPKEQRGPAFAYKQFVMFTAVPVVAFLAWQLVPQTILGLDGWRWVVIIGSIGAFVIWWIRRNLPESPRWLEHHGRSAEADAIVSGLESRIRADGAALPARKWLP